MNLNPMHSVVYSHHAGRALCVMKSYDLSCTRTQVSGTGLEPNTPLANSSEQTVCEIRNKCVSCTIQESRKGLESPFYIGSFIRTSILCDDKLLCVLHKDSSITYETLTPYTPLVSTRTSSLCDGIQMYVLLKDVIVTNRTRT